MFAALAPGERDPQRYRTHYLGDAKVDGRPCWVLRSTPLKPDERMDQLTSWIDQGDITVVAALLHYRDGGHVTTHTRYGLQHGFELPAAQAVAFQLPTLRGTADVTYSHYEIRE